LTTTANLLKRRKTAFQGGTCLRIIYGLDRFSEDLDFALNTAESEFDLNSTLEKITPIMNAYGYEVEISGKDKFDTNVRKRFIKDDSIKKVIDFKHYADTRKKIKVKIEVDVNPPEGSGIEQKYIDFPIDFSIAVQDLSSLFAGKCHALLCRKFIKGRDWFDFSWYISKKVIPNLEMLKNALYQYGPWKNQNLLIDGDWLQETLKEKIISIDWKHAAKDVTRFLKPEKREVIDLWGADFFLKKVSKLFGNL
jgi:predicted nucleotidyltransferase component of viral defense system